MKVKYFDLARRLSKKSSYYHKIGACIVKKNKVLGLGYNKPYKTHPKSTTKYNTIHAELDAILDCSRAELEGSSIYVYREGAAGSPLLAKPCEHCRELIKQAGIQNVYFTVDGSFDSYENF